MKNFGDFLKREELWIILFYSDKTVKKNNLA